jgi:uncharacterized protein (TIGR02284 family)
MAATVKDVVSALNSLIEIDFDAIEAYQAAIARLSGAADKQALGEFVADHRRHVTELSMIVRNFGGQPRARGDLKQVLAKGKVVLGGLVGEKAVLEAMKSNEDDTNRAYEKATSEHGMPVDVLAVLERNLADERRHRAWFIDRLRAMTVPAPTPSAPAR